MDLQPAILSSSYKTTQFMLVPQERVLFLNIQQWLKQGNKVDLPFHYSDTNRDESVLNAVFVLWQLTESFKNISVPSCFHRYVAVMQHFNPFPGLG